MQLRGDHLGAPAALETRENADAAAAASQIDTMLKLFWITQDIVFSFLTGARFSLG
jgi:hypothetical protein